MGFANRTQDACASLGGARAAERKPMSRELIVSVNGREKKIAIIENDRVTEFYIERGEENQGIVGNLYKGRVMRVLPGMQSAFVDIGLERDAFLYVSDFFDEEAEFERIVVDSAKKGDAAGAEKAAAEKIAQARIEREHHIEATHERVDPLREAEAEALKPEPEAVAEAPEEETEETGARRRGRRGGRGRKRVTKGEAEPAREERSIIPHEVEPFDTPFVSAASFERVSDDEGVMNGEMLKDARLQERIMDEVHAAEFDLEDVPSAPVGSLFPKSFARAANFSGWRTAKMPKSPRRAPRAIEEAHVRDFVDEVVDESSRGAAFQRVSDDEDAVSQCRNQPSEPAGAAVEHAFAAKRQASSAGSSNQKKLKKQQTKPEPGSEDAASEEINADADASITTGRAHEEFATRRGGRRRRKPKPAGSAETEETNGQD